MKRILALFLAVVLTLGMLAIPVSAQGTEVHEKSPIIFISGSSIDICDAEGNIIPTGFDVLTDDDDEDGGISTDAIIESTFNILKPFLLEGLPFNKWDNYGEALYEELAPIWDQTQIGGDGNAKYGTGVSAEEIAYWDNRAATVNTGKDGKFNLNDYKFRYDWRLSPYDHVDRLHEYIKTILKTTKCDQVCLISRCIGGEVITAYLERYGSEGLVKKVMYDETLSNGASVISDVFSGQLDFSDKHIQTYLLESEYFGLDNVGIDLAGVDTMLLTLAEKCVDYMTQSGVLQGMLWSVEKLYERLAEAFLPSMLLATGMGTWLSYWATVYEKDFDAALKFMFGNEGSERRAEFAGLIEKIEYIREHNTAQYPGLYTKFAEEYGVEIGAIAAYGLVNPPLGVHHDETGDVLVGVSDASFGATAAGLYDTLPQEYIDERIEAGYGDYISPDGKIDASTCMFPETTWFVKNKHHDYVAVVSLIGEYFTQYTNVTVNNNKGINRFLVHQNDATGQVVNMTEENCQDGPWITAVVQKPTIKSIFKAFVDFIKLLFNFIKNLFNGEEAAA
ncbi:MAG: hypothetical protein E7523_04555 [Ruminococcaceae bacterium]|nr:hypothetical protein [Oscillospiraceae bacterium]